MALKQEIAKMRKEKRAGYFYDLSKVVFTTFGIGGLAPYLLGTSDSISWITVIAGSIVSVMFAIIGDNILK